MSASLPHGNGRIELLVSVHSAAPAEPGLSLPQRDAPPCRRQASENREVPLSSVAGPVGRLAGRHSPPAASFHGYQVPLLIRSCTLSTPPTAKSRRPSPLKSPVASAP